MNVDQVIFTSAESLMARGYRIAAASGGVTAEERSIIARRSPSHESLGDKSDGAVAISAYPLDSGRYCVARTHYAGQEQSGRGGKRVLTHVFVLAEGQLAAFGWNPFAVLRSLESAGAFDVPCKPHAGAPSLASVAVGRVPRPDETFPRAWSNVGSMTRPTHLDSVKIGPGAGSGHQPIAAALSLLSEKGFLYLLTRAMSDSCVVVANQDGPATAIEGILLAIPVPLRVKCDFSIGLRFAMARRYRINWLSSDATSARHHIRGQHIDLVENLPGGHLPEFQPSAWVRMAADCCRMLGLGQLAELAGTVFDDTSPAVLDYVADRQVAINHLHERTLDELLAALSPGETEPTTDIERGIDARYRTEVHRRVSMLLQALSDDELRTYWPRLLELSETAPDAGRVSPAVESLCGQVRQRLEGASRLGPITAHTSFVGGSLRDEEGRIPDAHGEAAP